MAILIIMKNTIILNYYIIKINDFKFIFIISTPSFVVKDPTLVTFVYVLCMYCIQLIQCFYISNREWLFSDARCRLFLVGKQ